MIFGLTSVLTDKTVTPVDFGRMAEDHGFASVFLPEHSHVPVDQRTEDPGQVNYPDSVDHWPHFSRIVDPIVSLAAIASVTSSLLLATGTVVLPEHDPILLSKAIATLDHASDGRVLFGVGAGWNLEELANHGVSPEDRFSVHDEKLRAIQAIWDSTATGFEGRHVSFAPLRQWPKPKQQPRVPILLAGQGPRAVQRVLELDADQWLVSGEVSTDHQDLGPRIEELRALGRERGRGHIPVVLQRATAEPQAVELYERMGIDHCVFGVPSASAPEALEAIRAIELVIKPFR